MMFPSSFKYIDNDCSTDNGLHYSLGMHREGGGVKLALPGGGWDDQRLLRGAPLFSLWGGALHRGKVGFTPLYPGVKPTPPWLPVPHRVKLKFLVGNNSQPPSPKILPTSNGNGWGWWSLWRERSATWPLARFPTVMGEEVAFRGNLEKKLMIYQINGSSGFLSARNGREGKVGEQNNW